MAFYQLADGEEMAVEGAKVDGTLTYHADPYDTFAGVYAAAVANTPTSYGGAARLQIRPKLIAGTVWSVTVAYGSPTSEKPAMDANTPTTLPGPPPTPDPSNVPPLADPPSPLVPIEGQLGGPPGPGSFDPPGGGDGGDGTGGGLPDPIPRDQALGAEWSFDTTGGTAKVVQSIFTPYGRAYGGFDFLAPDLKGAIGSTEDGVEGVEIVTAKLRVTVTLTVRKITGGYLDAISALTGCVNNAPFLWWDEGEVLFVGSSGAVAAPAGWKITFEFWISKNRTDVAIIAKDDRPGATAAERAGLVLPKVEGWQYVDVGYEADTPAGTDSKKKVRRLPKTAYVHTVYHKKDFTAMGFR